MENQDKSRAMAIDTDSPLSAVSPVQSENLISSTDNKKQSENKKKDTLKILQLPLMEMLSQTNAGVFVTDENNKVIWLNEPLIRYGFTGAEIRVVLGKDAFHAIHFFQEFLEEPLPLFKEVKALMEEKKTYLGVEMLCKNGKLILLDYIPVFQDHIFCGTVWQLRDITKKINRIQDEEQAVQVTYFKMLTALNIMFCKINPQGEILTFSNSFHQFTGYSKRELQHTNIVDLCTPEEDRKAFRKNIQEGLKNAKFVPFEVGIIIRNGAPKWIQCQVARLISDPMAEESRDILLIITDISEQKAIQRELEFARKFAESGQLAQQQFLANMSHEIRTPLNAIIGMSYLLEGTPLNGQQGDYVAILKNASNILLGLINDVLDFAKIESGKQEVQRREFGLPGLIHALAQTFTFKMKSKPVKFTCEIDPAINQVLLGDDILLNQILMNLLGNAEKFTEKGEIKLQVSLLRQYENIVWIEFKIADTGIGISPERINEIFKDYIQGSEAIRLQYGGSGLGLFICKKLIDILGGEIKATSSLGKGTVFTFTLPFVQTGQLLQRDKSRDMSKYDFKADEVKVLIVEDNPMNLKYLTSLLDKVHLSFDVATNGKEALRCTQERYYNLILMDIKLPEMNGIEVAQNIRETDNSNIATPIVLVTAAALQSTIEQAKKAGINELLTKPYTPNQLVSILKKYLITDEEEEEKADEDMANMEGFKFNPVLDVAYLNKLYAADGQSAIGLFQVFLDCMSEDWQLLQEAIQKKDWQRLKGLVHKLKPNFSMVGLTNLTKMMQVAYEDLQQGNVDHALEQLAHIQKEMDRNIPLVEKELERMQDFYKQEVI